MDGTCLAPFFGNMMMETARVNHYPCGTNRADMAVFDAATALLTVEVTMLTFNLPCVKALIQLHCCHVLLTAIAWRQIRMTVASVTCPFEGRLLPATDWRTRVEVVILVQHRSSRRGCCLSRPQRSLVVDAS